MEIFQEVMTCEDHIAGVRNMVVENWEAAL